MKNLIKSEKFKGKIQKGSNISNLEHKVFYSIFDKLIAFQSQSSIPI